MYHPCECSFFFYLKIRRKLNLNEGLNEARVRVYCIHIYCRWRLSCFYVQGRNPLLWIKKVEISFSILSFRQKQQKQKLFWYFYLMASFILFPKQISISNSLESHSLKYGYTRYTQNATYKNVLNKLNVFIRMMALSMYVCFLFSVRESYELS